MPAEYVPPGNVRAACPGCAGALSTYEQVSATGGPFGQIVREVPHKFEGRWYGRIIYRLLRCAGCGRGGLAMIHDGSGLAPAVSHFYPFSPERAPLPPDSPAGVVAEVREAELCAAVRAWRAASALLRSALEKTLIANGYQNGSLKARIDEPLAMA